MVVGAGLPGPHYVQAGLQSGTASIGPKPFLGTSCPQPPVDAFRAIKLISGKVGYTDGDDAPLAARGSKYECCLATLITWFSPSLPVTSQR